eukprot:174635-Rhodomonas_salina.3
MSLSVSVKLSKVNLNLLDETPDDLHACLHDLPGLDCPQSSEGRLLRTGEVNLAMQPTHGLCLSIPMLLFVCLASAADLPHHDFGDKRWIMNAFSVTNFTVKCCLFGQQFLNHMETLWLARNVLGRGVVEPNFVHQARNTTAYEDLTSKRSPEYNYFFHSILGTIPVSFDSLFLPAALQEYIGAPLPLDAIPLGPHGFPEIDLLIGETERR